MVMELGFTVLITLVDLCVAGSRVAWVWQVVSVYFVWVSGLIADYFTGLGYFDLCITLFCFCCLFIVF